MKLSKLYRQKQRLVQELGRLGDIMRGSIVVLKRPCINPHCSRCKLGIKHPTVYYSVNIKGKTKLIYFPKVVQGAAKNMVNNYRTLKVLIDKISAVNAEILLKKAKEKRR